MRKKLTGYDVGALLYCPANAHTSIADALVAQRFPTPFSLAFCLGYGLLVADILLPLCYKLGPERARPYMYLVVFLPVILLFGGAQLGMFDALDLSFLNRMPETMLVGAFSLTALIPLLGLGLSYLISCRIIEGKEF